MASRQHWVLVSAQIVCSIVALNCFAQDVSTKPQFAGPTETGFLLPNGWHLTPVGKHIETSDMVLNIHPLRDSRHAIATTNGFNEHKLLLLDIADQKMIASATSLQSWYGLAVDSTESLVWWSGGGAGFNHHFQLVDKQWRRISDPEVDTRKFSQKELADLRDKLKSENGFRAGVLLDEKRQCLYSLHINAGKLVATQLSDPKSSRELALGGRPYDIQFVAGGRLLYVSDWANAQVIVVEADTMRLAAKIKVGIHPNQMVVHPTDGRVFVACASSNGVWVIDAEKGVVTETIYTSLFPASPEGSTPDALALSPDGETLYVANADNNCIAVIDVEEENKSAIEGFIPTGWYPTSVAVTPDGKQLLIGVGKGLQSKPNPFVRKEDSEKGQTSGNLTA